MDVHRGVRRRNARISGTVPWCSGLAYVPVKDEIAGSNPVGTAAVNSSSEEWLQIRLRFGRNNHAAGNRDLLEDAPRHSPALLACNVTRTRIGVSARPLTSVGNCNLAC